MSWDEWQLRTESRKEMNIHRWKFFGLSQNFHLIQRTVCSHVEGFCFGVWCDEHKPKQDENNISLDLNKGGTADVCSCCTLRWTVYCMYSCKLRNLKHLKQTHAAREAFDSHKLPLQDLPENKNGAKAKQMLGSGLSAKQSRWRLRSPRFNGISFRTA